ncbi:MAG: N-6 DNA methylase [Saprospiraceae bacterium]
MAKQKTTEQEEPLEKKLWKTADKLRKNMDAAEYKHVVLGPSKMNLAIQGIDSSNVKWNNEGSFVYDAHRDLKAGYIIANPPFNDSDWSGERLRDDGRWQYYTTLFYKIKTNTQQIRTLTGVRDMLLLEGRMGR